MIVTAVTARSRRRVTIAGHITSPLASPLRQVTVTRRVSCGGLQRVARFTPDADGRFTITLAGPSADHVYTFRFHTTVPFKPALPRLYPTFTLPRYVVGT